MKKLIMRVKATEWEDIEAVQDFAQAHDAPYVLHTMVSYAANSTLVEKYEVEVDMTNLIEEVEVK